MSVSHGQVIIRIMGFLLAKYDGRQTGEETWAVLETRTSMSASTKKPSRLRTRWHTRTRRGLGL